MTTRYKVKVKIGQNGNAMIGVTVQQEKFLFVDRRNLGLLESAIERGGPEGVRDWFELSDNVKFMLNQYPEQPPSSVLGLESDWKSLPDGTADVILKEYFLANPVLNISSQTNGNEMAILIAAGAASVRVPVTRDELDRNISEATRLKSICEDGIAKGEDPKTVLDGIEAAGSAVAAGTAVTGAIATCATSSTGGLAGGPLVAAAACIGGFLGTLLGLKGWLDGMDKQRRLDQLERERREKEGNMCSDVGADIGDRIDRISRTA